MATPLQNCVIALSGKFDTTHGKQQILASLGSPRYFTLSPSVNMAYGIFRRLTSSWKAHIGALIKKYGGMHVTKIPQEQDNAAVTHLVTTAKHIEANTAKGESLGC